MWISISTFHKTVELIFIHVTFPLYNASTDVIVSIFTEIT